MGPTDDAKPSDRRPRDRDQRGRPRSNRPRDELGRPLPRGAVGVSRAPEGQRRTVEQTIQEAQRLLDEGLPFHAHEVFEDMWKSARAEERDLWRGLAQFAVGLTHAARGNARGADALLRRGAASMRRYAAAAPHGLNVAGLLAWSSQAAAAVRADEPMPPVPPLRAISDRSGLRAGVAEVAEEDQRRVRADGAP